MSGGRKWRNHPFLAAVAVACLAVIGAIGFFVVYPQLAGVYHWRRAQRAIERHDFAQAQIHLQRCREVWPNSAEAWFLLARTNRRANDFDAARTDLQRAESLGWAPGLIELERLLMVAQAGFVQAVQPQINWFFETRRDEQQIILEAMVVGSLQSNFLDDAFRWSSRWTEDYPDDCQGHFLHGRVLEAGLRYDLAAEEYQRAVECKPDLMAARLGLGEMLLRTGQYALALPQFQICLQADPNQTTARMGVARCQRYLSPPETVLATLEPFFANNEEHAEAFLLRGEVELERGRNQEGLVWLQRAQRLLPPDLEIYQALATAMRLLDRTEEARAYEAKRRETEHDLRRMEDLTKDIIEHPRDCALRYEAGTILLRLGQNQQGARWLASVLLIDPNHQPTKDALAACLPKLGDPKLVAEYRHLLGDPR
jgi:tetratricopeptide (TPR) repeat protein